MPQKLFHEAPAQEGHQDLTHLAHDVMARIVVQLDLASVSAVQKVFIRIFSL